MRRDPRRGDARGASGAGREGAGVGGRRLQHLLKDLLALLAPRDIPHLDRPHPGTPDRGLPRLRATQCSERPRATSGQERRQHARPAARMDARCGGRARGRRRAAQALPVRAGGRGGRGGGGAGAWVGSEKKFFWRRSVIGLDKGSKRMSDKGSKHASEPRAQGRAEPRPLKVGDVQFDAVHLRPAEMKCRQLTKKRDARRRRRLARGGGGAAVLAGWRQTRTRLGVLERVHFDHVLEHEAGRLRTKAPRSACARGRRGTAARGRCGARAARAGRRKKPRVRAGQARALRSRTFSCHLSLTQP
jgi:hypothetical protein